ncbi:MAG: ferredoxin reductase [Polyangiaceae bacterium]
MSRVQSLLTSTVRRFGLETQASFWLRELNSTWTLRELRARVVRVTSETADVKTFEFEPNRWWKGHVAGQFVNVEVEIDGVRHRRCYSLSSAPSAPRPTITVKRVPGGKVSNFLHDRVKVDDVLTLGAAAGDFKIPVRIPEMLPRKLLFVSGGSGATPVMSMLRERAAWGVVDDVVYVHAARTAEDILFADELVSLAEQFPGLRLRFAVESGDAPAFGTTTLGRLDVAALSAMVPDLASREAFMCGPSGMMDALAPAWTETGLDDLLRTERFTAPTPAKVPTTAPEKVRLTLVGSNRAMDATPDESLLEVLEGAGMKPAHGCRMGICNTCLCKKKSGAVLDTTTGAVSTDADEDIRLCVSRALSDVELAV